MEMSENDLEETEPGPCISILDDVLLHRLGLYLCVLFKMHV